MINLHLTKLLYKYETEVVSSEHNGKEDTLAIVMKKLSLTFCLNIGNLILWYYIERDNFKTRNTFLCIFINISLIYSS